MSSLVRASVFLGVFAALACGDNTFDYVPNASLDGNQAIDANAAQAANVTTGGNVATSPNQSTSHTPTNANTTMKCPTPSTPVTYTNMAKTLIADNCLSCHNSRGPAMNTYANAKTAFGTGGGLFAVQNGVMPPSQKLSFDVKCNFQAWGDNNFAQ